MVASVCVIAPVTIVVPVPANTRSGLATVVAWLKTEAKVSVPPPAMLLVMVWTWDPAVETGVFKVPALRLTPLAPVKFKPQLAAVEVVVRLPTVMVLLPVPVTRSTLIVAPEAEFAML